MKMYAKRVLCLLCAVLMAFGLLSGVALPAAVAVSLTNNDVIVNLSWTAGTVPATYTYQGKTYNLTWGTNAFSVLQTAVDTAAAGANVILCPGTYSAATTITKNLQILGPKAGIDPNVRGATYTDDWTLSPQRGSGEAILTANLHLGVNGPTVYSDCTAVTVDGITVSGSGQLRSNCGNEGHADITLRNIIIKDSTTSNEPIYLRPYYGSTNSYIRNIVIENFRLMGSAGAGGRSFAITADTLDISGVYMEAGYSHWLFGALTTSWSVASTAAVTFRIHDCMFRDVSDSTHRSIYMDVKSDVSYSWQGTGKFNKDIAEKASVTVRADNNVFVNTGGEQYSAAFALNTDNVSMEIVNNTFINDTAPRDAYKAVCGYSTDTSRDYSDQLTISGNRFINAGNAFSFDQAGGTVDLSGNYYEKENGVVSAPVTSGTVSSSCTWYYLDPSLTVRSDGSGPAAVVPAGRLYDIENEVRWFGRTYVGNSDEHYFNWTNSGFEFTFYGTGATARLLSTNNYSNNSPENHIAYLVVYVDGIRQTPDIEMDFSEAYVALASGLSNGSHTIKVVKRTNGRSSTAALTDLWINDGNTKLIPPPTPLRKMQFIGDSITVGYGSIGTDPVEWSTATEDGTVTYAALTAQYFGADNHTIAISGRGIVRNTGGDNKKLMPVLYQCIDYTMCPDYAPVDPSKIYDNSLYQADVVVINLGTNDAGSNNSDLTTSEFKAGCKAFIQQVRAAQPNAIIIYAYGFMTTTYGTEASQAVAELNAAGDSNIYYLPLATITSDEKHIGHPNGAAHADRANTLIAKVAELTGWTEGAPDVSLPKGSFYVLGYSGVADGEDHTVTVCGTQEGDTITYSTNGVDYSAVKPSFDEVGEHIVYVKLERDNYAASVATAKVCLSNEQPEPLFTLTPSTFQLSNYGVDKKSFTWKFSLAATEALHEKWADGDIHVYSLGILYSTNTDDLTNYVYNERHGLDNEAYSSTVKDTIYRIDKSGVGLSRLRSTFSMRFTNVKINKVRAAVAYIRYFVGDDLCTEYSDLAAATSIMDGYINGVRPISEEIDPLDD